MGWGFSLVSRGKRLLHGFFVLCTSQENALFRNWSISIQSNHWVWFIRRFSNKLFISFNLDFWKIMRLLFLLLLCVLILARSAPSPHIPLVMQRRDLLKFLITFRNKTENPLYLVSKLCIILATFFLNLF